MSSEDFFKEWGKHVVIITASKMKYVTVEELYKHFADRLKKELEDEKTLNNLNN